MQNAGTVVEVLRARGRRGLPCERLYRQLFNTELFLMAWGRIYANDGAMTPGINGRPRMACHWPRSGGSSMRCATSATGSSQLNGFTSRRRTARKGRSACRHGPVNWSARWCASCWKRTDEPRFSGRSHGFRPGRGCHTALTEVAKTWKGTTWFIEGDISDCFGLADHSGC